jgi:hypothetical protein
MSLMYRARDAAGPLEQGDILQAVPWLNVQVTRSRVLVPDENGGFVVGEHSPSAPDDCFLAQLQLVDALVVTQSCDALRGATILLAPIEALIELSPRPERRSAEVRRIATGLGEIGRFYLPDLPPRDIPRRVALLDSCFSLDREDLSQFVRERRSIILGLTARGVEYLQFRLGVVFGRNAREDEDWPSTEDLSDRISSLDARLSKPFSDEHQRQLRTEEREEVVKALERVRDHVASTFGTPVGGARVPE